MPVDVGELAAESGPDTELFGSAIAPSRLERISSAIGVGRPGTPDDVAQEVRWLASPQAGFVNGMVIEVDGGRRRQD